MIKANDHASDQIPQIHDVSERSNTLLILSMIPLNKQQVLLCLVVFLMQLSAFHPPTQRGKKNKQNNRKFKIQVIKKNTF